MLLFVCLLGLFAPSSTLRAYPARSGSCSGSPSSPIEETLGSWHEYARTPSAFEPGLVCVNFTFFERHRDGVTLQGDATIRLSGARLVLDGHYNGSLVDGAYLGKFPKHASVHTGRNRFLVSKSKQWMLWQLCLDQNQKIPRQTLTWVFSKTPELDGSELKQINKELLKWKIRSSVLEKTDNTDCPHYHDIIGELGKHLASSHE